MAAALVASGADLLVVGGTARALAEPHAPTDLDIAISSDDESIGLVVTALERLGVRPAPSHDSLTERAPWRVVTSYGPLDIFVRDDLHVEPSLAVTIAGVRVRAATTDRRGDH